MAGLYTLDEFRHAIERMNPVEYITVSYYEHWLASLEMMLGEKGIVTPEELEARMKEIETQESDNHG